MPLLLLGPWGQAGLGALLTCVQVQAVASQLGTASALCPGIFHVQSGDGSGGPLPRRIPAGMDTQPRQGCRGGTSGTHPQTLSLPCAIGCPTASHSRALF